MKVFFRNFLRLLLCFALFSGDFPVLSQSSSITNKEIARLEKEAQRLSLEWNRQSIQKAIEVCLHASEKWIELNNRQKAAECLREAARFQQILGEKDKSEQTLTNALDLVKDKQHFGTESRVYSDLSVLAMENGQTDKSRQFFEKALSLAAESNDISAQAAALFSAGEFYYFRNETKNSLDSYKKSIDLWRAAQNSQGEAKTL